MAFALRMYWRFVLFDDLHGLDFGSQVPGALGLNAGHRNRVPTSYDSFLHSFLVVLFSLYITHSCTLSALIQHLTHPPVTIKFISSV
jgi:hypothetical protein